MLFIIFVLMNEVELLVHGREVTLEQQKAIHARVIWCVPCMLSMMHPHVHLIKLHYTKCIRVRVVQCASSDSSAATALYRK